MNRSTARGPCVPGASRQDTVLVLIVSMEGGTSAVLLETRPDGRVDYTDQVGSRSLAEFLADPHLRLPSGATVRRVIPPGTPVIRFDRVPWEQAFAFAVHGPIMLPRMPVGQVDLFRGAPRPFRGESWTDLGPLAQVALDVYLVLAGQAGIVIEHIGDPRAFEPDAADRPAPATGTDPESPTARSGFDERAQAAASSNDRAGDAADE